MTVLCLGGCGTLIASGSRCPACTPRSGSTRRWRELRLAVLARDGHLCQFPAGDGICGRPAEHVDHVTPVSRGGTDYPGNLRAACAQHNLSKGAR